MTPREIRLIAADLIEVNGWTRNAARRGRRMCLTAALYMAGANAPGLPPIGAVAFAITDLRNELGVIRLEDWNDAQRSRTTVLRALRGQS